MRISDWSSDVCSSDLLDRGTLGSRYGRSRLPAGCLWRIEAGAAPPHGLGHPARARSGEIGRQHDLAVARRQGVDGAEDDAEGQEHRELSPIAALRADADAFGDAAVDVALPLDDQLEPPTLSPPPF